MLSVVVPSHADAEPPFAGSPVSSSLQTKLGSFLLTSYRTTAPSPPPAQHQESQPKRPDTSARQRSAPLTSNECHASGGNTHLLRGAGRARTDDDRIMSWRQPPAIICRRTVSLSTGCSRQSRYREVLASKDRVSEVGLSHAGRAPSDPSSAPRGLALTRNSRRGW